MNSKPNKQLEFAITYQVEFGQSVGVIGSLQNLGEWSQIDFLPLNWTEGHVWKGQISIDQKIDNSKFECKFVVFHKSSQSQQIKILEMEAGANRQYNINNPLQFDVLTPQKGEEILLIEEKFNSRKISFSVFSHPSATIHISGNTSNLREPQPLILQTAAASCGRPEIDSGSEMVLFSGTFYIDMRVQIIRYHFIRNLDQIERGIGRYMILDSTISKPFGVQYSDYQPDIFRDELSCDQIVEDLFVGTFLNSSKDVEYLQSKGVTAIVSLQTPRDMERKFVDVKEISRFCQSKGITFVNAPIRDNDPQHYIKRAPDVLKIVEDLFKANHKIYIHCTAGIGRAPQTALLHLILHRGMNLKEASQLIFSKRPVSSPNYEAISSVLASLLKKKTQKSSSNNKESQFVDEISTALPNSQCPRVY